MSDTRTKQIDIYGDPGWSRVARMVSLTNADAPPWDEADSIVLPAQREPSSPVGPIWGDRKPLCKPCGHTWSEHDDQGCLWNLCQCSLPGERK